MKTGTCDIFVCPTCGSRNVELKNNSLLDDISGIFSKIMLPSPKDKLINGGRKFLVCKDCGHKAILQIL